MGNSQNDQFAGPIDITGSGSSSCENATVGQGNLTVNAFSAINQLTGNPAVLCTTLTGSYVRTLTDISAVVGATGLLRVGCRVNGNGTGRIGHVAIVVHAELVPTNRGAGTTTGVTLAVLAGSFVIFPA